MLVEATTMGRADYIFKTNGAYENYVIYMKNQGFQFRHTRNFSYYGFNAIEMTNPLRC